MKHDGILLKFTLKKNRVVGWGFALTGLDRAQCQDILKSSELWVPQKEWVDFGMMDECNLSNMNRSVQLIIIMICV